MLGDHIRALKNGRWFHAIDLGDQRVLFLVDQPGLPPADRLRRVYRPDFTAGANRVELVVHRERTDPAKAVVARAWSRFMDPSVVAMFADSEQFAAWCKIGRLPEVAPPPARPARKAAATKIAPAKPVSRKAAAKKAPSRPAAGRKVAPKKVTAKARPTTKKAAKKAVRPAVRKVAARAISKKAAPARAKRPVKGPAKKKGRR